MIVSFDIVHLNYLAALVENTDRDDGVNVSGHFQRNFLSAILSTPMELPQGIAPWPQMIKYEIKNFPCVLRFQRGYVDNVLLVS